MYWQMLRWRTRSHWILCLDIHLLELQLENLTTLCIDEQWGFSTMDGPIHRRNQRAVHTLNQTLQSFRDYRFLPDAAEYHVSKRADRVGSSHESGPEFCDHRECDRSMDFHGDSVLTILTNAKDEPFFVAVEHIRIFDSAGRNRNTLGRINRTSSSPGKRPNTFQTSCSSHNGGKPPTNKKV